MPRRAARRGEAPPGPLAETDGPSTRGAPPWLARNLVVAGATLLLFLVFIETRAGWDPMHAQNRALADASVVLLVATLAIGPLARLWPPAARLVPWRREMGNWAVYTALGHVWVVFSGWAMLDPLKLFVSLNVFKRDWALDQGFALANLLGLVALAYGLVLLATSNEASVRLLGGSGWKFVQQGVYVLYVLVALHTAYFLFFHFVSFHRPVPPPNWAQGPFLVLVGLLLALQTAAFVATVRRRRRGGGRERGEDAGRPGGQSSSAATFGAGRHAPS